MAIRTAAPRGKSLVTTIWQDPEDAPSTALRYCILHGVMIAASLAQLSASGETTVAIGLTADGQAARNRSD